MDSSNVFQLMLDKAIESEPLAFEGFNRTKNVQNQLQEMIGKFDLFHFWRKVFSMDDEGVDYEQPKWTYHCDSWDQLWLALAMKELHNKTWDSVKEEWINE